MPQELNGVQIGDWLHHRKTAASMMEVAYAEFDRQLESFLTTKNEFTAALPYVGTAADKVCDSVYQQWQPLCHRVNFKGRPISVLLKLCKVTNDATGEACWHKIKEAESGKKVQPSQSISFAFDGEACYNGNGELSAKSRIKAERPTAEVIHDYPHAEELLKDDMQKKVPYTTDVVHDMVRKVYSHMAKSPKRMRGMHAVAKEMEVDIAQLHYLFEVRMVESETIVLRNFLIDFPVIVQYLRECVQEAEAAQKVELVHIQQRGWIKQLCQFKFVSFMLCMLDQDTELRIFSKNTQSDSAYALEVPVFKDHLKKSLQKLSMGGHGPNVARNLEQLKQGKFAGVKLLNIPGSAAQDGELPEDELEVRYVHDKRARGSGFQYLLEWVGYPDAADFTWEAKSKLCHCQRLIENYEDRQAAKASGDHNIR